MGKSTINGPFSIAMLNYQRVHPIIFPIYISVNVCPILWVTRLHHQAQKRDARHHVAPITITQVLSIERITFFPTKYTIGYVILV